MLGKNITWQLSLVQNLDVDVAELSLDFPTSKFKRSCAGVMESLGIDNTEYARQRRDRYAEVGCTRESIVPLIRSAMHTLIGLAIFYLFLNEMKWYFTPEL